MRTMTLLVWQDLRFALRSSARTPTSPKPNGSRVALAVLHQPTVFMIHFLGGSARTWDAMIPYLSARFRCVGIDLPGFGDAAATLGDGVTEMADVVVRAVRTERPESWWLVGHSMGAKIATVLARRAEDGDEGLVGLSRLVLLAGSPPGPEPMTDDRRRTMMGWFEGDPATSRAEAAGFIDQALGGELPRMVKDKLVADVLRVRRTAWRAWLDGGSREDWSDRVGVLRTPTLIVAGGSDGDLGPAAQGDLMARHFASARLVVLAGAGHLLPLERAQDIAELIAEPENGPDSGGADAAPGQDYAALIASDRVSARTRAVLHQRGLSETEQNLPTFLESDLLAGLRAVVDRVIPQPEGHWIDLAARIDADLATGRGDGWRFALLPPDPAAYRAGLETLNAAASCVYGRTFVALNTADQDQLLERAARGDLAAHEDRAQGAGARSVANEALVRGPQR